jgi:crossover junction endodeoxyribonuclease RuvC
MQRSERHILGIDPGLHVTGYAVVAAANPGPRLVEAGVVRSEGADMPARLVSLHAGLAEIVAQFQPDVMVVEELYAHSEYPRTSILMGHARGVLLLTAAQAGVPIVSYASTAIKKLVTGHGRASKEQMQQAIQREFGLAAPPDPPDVADALALALCHYFNEEAAAARSVAKP